MMEAAMKEQHDPAGVNFTSKKSSADRFKASFMETFFPDYPIRQIRREPTCWRRVLKGLKYFLPVLEWGPKYTLNKFKYDLIAGITISSISIPQGISYASLANVPAIIGLYSCFVPPLVYAAFGSSNTVSIGTVAATSLLLGVMIGSEVSHKDQPELYLSLFFTATFFAGVMQAALGLFRLGILIDYLSRPTIIGFMGGTSIVIIMQQFKGIFGLEEFTSNGDIVSVMRSVFTQTDQWKWQSAVLGIILVAVLMATRYLKDKKPKLFWVSAVTPLIVVVLGSVVSNLANAEDHGIPSVGPIEKGINPLSITRLTFKSKHVMLALRAGLLTGFLGLAEGIAVGRSLAIKTNEPLDVNKEMIAFGFMNIVGSGTSCYLASGAFSKSAVNYEAGCKTPMVNVLMSLCMLIVVIFFAPFFRHTPQVALSAIIMSAMFSLIQYDEAYILYKVDKFDFLICMVGFFGVIFIGMDTGLLISMGFSMLRALLHVARPRTFKLGKYKNSMMYRDIEQYPESCTIPGVLILQLGSPIYFANAGYLKERVVRWVEEETTEASTKGHDHLQYVILEMGGTTSIDKSGMEMLHELQGLLRRRGIKMVLTDPRLEVMQKLVVSKIVDKIGEEWIFLSINDAVIACQMELQESKHKPEEENERSDDDNDNDSDNES